jgi:hypothetical protein
MLDKTVLFLSIGLLISCLLLILIHFFGVRIRKTLKFSNNQFLQSVLRLSKATQNFKNITVFLIRAIALIFLSLAFILFFSNHKAGNHNLEQSLVIIDDSWSMASRFRDGSSSKLDKLAQDLKKVKSPFGKSVLYTSSNAELNADSLSALNPSFSQRIFNSGKINPDVKHQVAIASDFQRNGGLISELLFLTNKQKVNLLHYGVDSQNNVFVDSVWAESPLSFASGNISLLARIKSTGPNKLLRVKAKLLSGINHLGNAEVPLNEDGIGTAKFVLNSASEELLLRLVVDDSGNPFDNEYFAVLPKSERIEISLYPSLTNRNPMYKALQQEGGFILHNGTIKQSSIWIYQAEDGITKSSQAKMIDWLRQGKSIILVPSLNSASSIVELMKSLGIRNITQSGNSISKLPLASPDYTDPFFDEVFEKQFKKITTPSLAPILHWQSSFHSILSFQDNSPFLSSFKIGAGFVHLFAAPLEGSEFSNHPLFVPVLYQLLLNSRSKLPLAFSGNHEKIVFPITTYIDKEFVVELRKGNNVFLPEQKVQGKRIELVMPQQLSQPGFYEFAINDIPYSTIAINIPSEESNLQNYSITELQDIFKKSKYPVTVIQADENQSLEKLMEKDRDGPDLAKYCLILCILLLLVEIFVLRNRKSESAI